LRKLIGPVSLQKYLFLQIIFFKKTVSNLFFFSFKWDGEWHFTHSFIHRAARGAFGRWCMNFSIFNKPYAKRVWR